jgi:hypothetical protein
LPSWGHRPIPDVAGGPPQAAIWPGLLAGDRAVPLQCLTSDSTNGFEVPVTVQQGQPLQFRRRGDDEVHGSGAVLLSTPGQQVLDVPRPVKRSVIDRYPAKDGPQILDALRAIRRGAGAVEELKLGDAHVAISPAAAA